MITGQVALRGAYDGRFDRLLFLYAHLYRAIQLWYLVLWPPATARINMVSRADVHGRVVSSLLDESERARMGLPHFEL